MLKGYLLAFFTIMMWSLNLIYSSHLAGALTPVQISFYRWFIASIIMLPFFFKNLQTDWQNLKKHWLLIFIMALSGISGINYFIYHAGYTASPTNMALISILGPIFLIILSAQAISFLQILGISVTVFGVLLIILDGNFTNLTDFNFVPGDVFMLGSALLFAIYSLSQRKLPDNIHSSSLLLVAILLSTLIFTPAFVYQFSLTDFLNLDYQTWAILFILGFANSFLAYLCWDNAVPKIGTVAAGSLYYTMPIFTMFFSYIFLNQTPDFIKLIGIAVISLGIVFVIYPQFKHK